jgi:hypothetical protein
MLGRFACVIAVSMQIIAQSRPPQILQIYRDPLKPGSHSAYREIEQDIARVCGVLGFPHPYPAIEPLTGPEEVWFLNGWESTADQKQVAEAYVKNAPLVAALETNAKRKAGLLLKPVNVFANYRQDLSGGVLATQQIVSQVEAAEYIQTNACETDSRDGVLVHRLIVDVATDGVVPGPWPPLPDGILIQRPGN